MSAFFNALIVIPVQYFLLFSFIVLISCNKDNDPIRPEPVLEEETCSFMLEQLEEAEEQENCTLQLAKLNYVQEKTIGDRDTNFVTQFTIDNCGKVIQEIHDNHIQDNLSYTSEFKYNEAGEIIKEFRNGVIYRYVEWVDNKANVYDRLCNKLSTFLFENGRIIEYTSSYPNSNIIKYILEYDNTGNLISIEDDVRTGVPYEFLEFSTETENPFYLLNSISILRFELRPFMKYVHGTEKRNPHTILDVYYSLAFFNLTYELDTLGRVTKIDNTKYFYTSTFSYN